MSNANQYTPEELNASLNHVTELAEGYYDELQRRNEQIKMVRGAIIGAFAGGHLYGHDGSEYAKSVLLQVCDLLDIKIYDAVLSEDSIMRKETHS
jgi:hypothetical protein